MFCGECGKLIKEGNKFCTGCGRKVEPILSTNKEKIKSDENIVEKVKEEKVVEEISPIKTINESKEESTINSNVSYVKESNDKTSIGLNILAFFIPIVGLILFVTMKNDTPKKAKSIGISALIGYILSMFVSIVLCIYIYGFALPNINRKYNNYPRYNRNYNFEIDRNYNI